MKVVALISGGKDSCYNMLQCVAEGHDIVALANLRPKDKDELDSYMYQTVGHHAVSLYAEAMGLPLFRRVIQGSSKQIGENYTETQDDEVEDLFYLLKEVKGELGIEGVSVGAILSDYQRVRVENVCVRLGLTSLAYLWRRDQDELLREMIACQISAIIIKVAGLGLDPEKHLGLTLQNIYPHMVKMNKSYGLNICGEGGEYETFTLDCPLFNKKIVVDKTEKVIHSNDAFAPVGYLNLKDLTLEEKNIDQGLPFSERIKDLPMKRSACLLEEFNVPPVTMATEGEPGNTEGTRDTVLENFHGEMKVIQRVREDGLFWITGIHAKTEATSDISQQAVAAMKLFRNAVQECQAEMADVVAVFLYIKSMADFVQVNTVYRQQFQLNPPCRVCVQVDLPANITLQIDCFGYRHSSQMSAVSRHTMHVQGLSHWAPANIGPYSQAVKLKKRIYVAGQIPLCPATMKIVEGGIVVQAALALRHVVRVLQAMEPQSYLTDTVLSVCYVTHRKYIKHALKAWESSLKKESKIEEMKMSSREPLITFVVVPMLPRDALVEWQIYASVKDENSPDDRSTCGEVTDVTQKCRIWLKYVQESSSPLSCLGSVEKLNDENQSATEVIQRIFQVYKVVLKRTDLTLADLPAVRMFYSSSVFTHEILCCEIKNYFEGTREQPVPVSLVPAQELSSPECILTVCH